MNTPLVHRSTQALLILLLAGCFSGEGAQQVESAAAPRTAAASPTSAPMPEPAAPAATIAQPATDGTTAPPPAPAAASTPLPPAPNQTNQATLARQWETTLGVAEPKPMDASTPTAPITPATPHAPIGNTQVKPFHPAEVAAKTHATQHNPLSGSQKFATQIAHSAVTPVAQSPASIRKARFTALASHLNSPVAIKKIEIPTVPQTMMMLKLGNVGISNFDDTAEVYFALKTSLQDWHDEHLDPGSSREFPCSLDANEACIFSMQTGEQSPVRYPLHQGDRYAIVWDSQNGIWDLRLAKNGDGGN